MRLGSSAFQKKKKSNCFFSGYKAYNFLMVRTLTVGVGYVESTFFSTGL